MTTHVIINAPDNQAAIEAKIRGNTNFTSPGATAVLSFIPAFFQAIDDLFRGIKHCHGREISKNILKIFTLPLGMITSLERIASLASFLITGTSLAALSFRATLCGIAFLGAELIFESFRLRDVVKFNTEILSNPSPETALEQMATKFHDEIHLEQLKRIVGERGLVAFNTYSHEVCKTKTSAELVSLLKEQVEKTRKVHVVGIAAISIAILTLALGFTVCPPLLLLSITIIGTVVEYGRYFAPAAYIEHEGKDWKWSACLPEFVQRMCASKRLTVSHAL